MNRKTICNYPVTIVMTVASLLVAFSPLLSQNLQLDFALVSEGEWWRVITGHVTHWGFSHLFWDLSMFAVLSAICEQRHRHWYAPAMIISLMLISATIAITCPTIATYRGLSGIDTGLFVWFVIDQMKISLRQGNKLIAFISGSAVIALLGKLLYEATTGGTLFVDSSTFVPLVQSHLAGSACGLAMGLLGIAIPLPANPSEPQPTTAKTPNQSSIAETPLAS